MHKKYVHFKRDLNRRKRAAQNSAERRVDREGWGKAETQSEHCPYQRNILKENKAPAFLRRRKSDCREVGCAEEGGEVQKKGRAADCSSIPADGKSEGREL